MMLKTKSALMNCDIVQTSVIRKRELKSVQHIIKYNGFQNVMNENKNVNFMLRFVTDKIQ